MAERLLLDSGPLSMVIHPRKNTGIVLWLESQLRKGIEVCIPEICDYEVRRNLLLEGLHQSTTRLDLIRQKLIYLPVKTKTMRTAATFWAQARKQGRPTADPKELDCDVILAAQALEVAGIVVTDNIGHLSLFVEAKRWTEIT